MVGKGSELSYRVRLMKLRLLPLDYWLEYLDLVFFYKCLNNMVDFTFEFDHYFSFVQGQMRLIALRQSMPVLPFTEITYSIELR